MDRYRIATQDDSERNKERILYKHGSALAVYFPTGLPKNGGSCHFATTKCLKWCLSSTANRREGQIYKFFTTAPLNRVFAKVFSEVQRDGSNMLYWFASGDCPPKSTTRILKLMKQFSDAGIIQLGFTRNQKLWEGSLKLENSHLVLTVEPMKEAKKLSDKGIVGVPNYNDGIVHLYKERHHSGGCGADWYEFKEVIRENDCQACREEQNGCFS